MTSVISSESMIITTAMAVSGAVIVLSLCRIKSLPFTLQHISSNPNSNSPLRPCLTSDEKKGEKKKKKKRVKFADNVDQKEVKIERCNVVAEKRKKSKKENVFMNNKKIPEYQQMPANRAALYHGILRDRVHRVC